MHAGGAQGTDGLGQERRPLVPPVPEQLGVVRRDDQARPAALAVQPVQPVADRRDERRHVAAHLRGRGLRVVRRLGRRGHVRPGDGPQVRAGGRLAGVEVAVGGARWGNPSARTRSGW